MRTIFIGDVHGCYDELIALTEKIKLTSEDKLYFVGDLINKGPKSKEVVEWIRKRPNTFAVIGNHDFFGIKQKNEIEKVYGKEETENFLSLQKSLGKENMDWLKNLPTFIEEKDWIMVHAGIHPKYGFETPTEIATTIRECRYDEIEGIERERDEATTNESMLGMNIINEIKKLFMGTGLLID